jgi:hypothetical protein
MLGSPWVRGRWCADQPRSRGPVSRARRSPHSLPLRRPHVIVFDMDRSAIRQCLKRPYGHKASSVRLGCRRISHHIRQRSIDNRFNTNPACNRTALQLRQCAIHRDLVCAFGLRHGDCDRTKHMLNCYRCSRIAISVIPDNGFRHLNGKRALSSPSFIFEIRATRSSPLRVISISASTAARNPDQPRAPLVASLPA